MPSVSGLLALSRLASTTTLDHMGLRPAVERLARQGARSGFGAAQVAGRSFAAVRQRWDSHRSVSPRSWVV